MPPEENLETRSTPTQAEALPGRSAQRGNAERSPDRIACLLLPDLPLTASLRAHPELAALPFVVTGGEGPRAEIVSASDAAARSGVRCGITLAHARTLCGDLVVRRVSPALEQATRAALLDVALSFSPRAVAAPDPAGVLSKEAAVHLDASGITRLYRSEEGFAGALCGRARRLGLPANVSLAASRSVSLLAARGLSTEGERTCVLAPAAEADFLAPLPIDLLDVDDSIAQALTRFGVHHVRDFLALPERALANRLGPRVLEWTARLRGTWREPPIPEPHDSRIAEAIDLDHPVDRLEPLVFVLQGLLSRLIDRLETRRLACGDLSLVLDTFGGGRDARRIGVSAPTHDLRVLLRLSRHALEARAPTAPVEALRVETVGRPVRSDQLDLFRPAGPSPAALDETVAALESLCGEERVGAPAVADDHHPDTYGVRAFRPRAPHNAGQRASTPVTHFTSPLAQRALRPPVAAHVRLHAGRPEAVRSAIVSGRVVRFAGPWRTTGGWWSDEGRFAFDSYDVQTSDGSVIRLRYDHVAHAWQIDAVYD
jgi:protein ImuB